MSHLSQRTRARARITRRVCSHPLRSQESSDIASLLINCPVEWRVTTAPASRDALQLKPNPTSTTTNHHQPPPTAINHHQPPPTTINHHPNSLCVLRVHDMTRHAPQPMACTGNVVVFGGIEQAAMRLHTITGSRGFDSHIHVTRTCTRARNMLCARTDTHPVGAQKVSEVIVAHEQRLVQCSTLPAPRCHR